MKYPGKTILVFYQYFGTPNGSWSTRHYEFSRRWVQQGYRVKIVTSPYEKSDLKPEGFITRKVVEGIEVILVNAPDSNRVNMFRRAWNAFIYTATSLYYSLFEPCDLVLSSSGPISAGIPGLIAKWVRQKPFVFEVRDLWPGGGVEMGKIRGKAIVSFFYRLEKLLYKNADLIVTCSQGQKDDIVSRYQMNGIQVITHGCDNELFGGTVESVPNGYAGKKVFTHVGSLGYIHNCKLIVEAAHILKTNYSSQPIEIIFLGEGAERQMLEEMSARYQLSNVHFMGLKPKRELPQWIQSSTATLFTTLNNYTQNTSSPNKIFDSFAAGVPVIQTTTGWIKTMVEQEQCGINVQPDDPESLALAMVTLAGNEALRNNLALHARRLALTTFNRDLLAATYLENVRSLIKS